METQLVSLLFWNWGFRWLKFVVWRDLCKSVWAITWDLLNDLIDLLHENLLQEDQMVEKVCGQVVLKWTNLHINKFRWVKQWLVCSSISVANCPQTASYLSYTAQIVALEVVPWLCREIVRCPALVRVALVFLHDVLSWHGDWRQGEAGWRRHGGHVHWGHLWLEAKLVVWQLKGETGLCP